MPFFSYNNKAVFYKVKGRGAPLFLLHGNTLSSKIYDGHVKFYSKYFKVIVFDFPGHGSSQKTDSFHPDYWADNAKVAVGIANILGLNRVNVIGAGGGALTALNMALYEPALINKIIADSFYITPLAEKELAGIKQERAAMKKNFTMAAAMFMLHGFKWKHVLDADTRMLENFVKKNKSYFPKKLSEIKSEVLLTGSVLDASVENMKENLEAISREIPNSEIYLFDEGAYPSVLTNKYEFRRLSLDFFGLTGAARSCRAKK